MSKLKLLQTTEGIILSVKIVPNSSRSSVEGLLENMLKIKISAVPEKGKANKELRAFLAKVLNIKPKDIEIMAGFSNPVKKVLIKTIDEKSFLRAIQQ